MEKLVPMTPLEAAVLLASLQLVLDAELPSGTNLTACLAIKHKLATLFEICEAALALVTQASEGQA